MANFTVLFFFAICCITLGTTASYADPSQSDPAAFRMASNDDGAGSVPLMSPQELVAKIKEAQEVCDYENYRRYRKTLLDGATKEVRDMRAAGQDPYADERVSYMHNALIQYPAVLDCGGTQRKYIARHGMSFEGGVGGIRLSLPRYRYLGTEFGGIINLSDGYDFEDEETTKTLHAGTSIELGEWDGLRPKLRLGLTYTDVSSGGDTGSFDPMGGFLLIPGTGAGSNGAGFSLPDAGGLNVVTSSRYSLDYRYFALHLKITDEFWCDDEDDYYDDEDDYDGGLFPRIRIGWKPYFGLNYTHGNFDQRFSGSIPGYARDFEYNTGVDVDSWGPIFGFQLLGPISGSPVTLRAGATGSVDFNDASGSDSLDFTGFGKQTMGLSSNETTFSYTLNAGLTIGAQGPLQFDLDGFYGSIGNTPVVTRDGVGPSHLDLQSSDYTGVVFRTRIQF